MKKFLLSLVAAVAVVTAHAQQPVNFQSYSFINPVITSLILTNLLGVTNVLSPTSRGTNPVSLQWSNAFNQRIYIANTNPSAAYNTNIPLATYSNSLPLFNDIPLVYMPPSQTPSGSLVATNILGTVSMTSCASGSNTLTFVLSPIYDGVNENTLNSQLYSFTLQVGSASGTTRTTTLGTSANAIWETTAAPIPWKPFMGAAKLRLVSITAADNDAWTNNIKALRFNTWVP